MKAAGSIVGAILAVGGPLVAALGAAVVLGACASCESTVRQASLPALASVPVNGAAFDERDRRLYLSGTRTHGIAVIDLSSPAPRLVGTIDVKHTPGEIVAAPSEYRLYAAMSAGKIAVIDTKATSPTYMQVVATILAGPTTADRLDYDAAKHQLLVSTGGDGQVIAIDTRINGIRSIYSVGPPVGQARYDAADGMVYVTVPSADAVYRIRPSDGVVTRKIVVKRCHPSAMAINPNGHVALVACRGSIGVVNLQSGDSTVTRNVAGADSITYDPASDRFAAASAHGPKDSAIGVFAGSGAWIGSVAASPNSTHAVFDNADGRIWASGAVGLLSLQPAACLPPPDWLKFAGGVSIFAAPLAAAALFLVLYARRMDRRPATKSRPEPTFSDLQKEDVAHERERMRALEDSIYGPEVNP